MDKHKQPASNQPDKEPRNWMAYSGMTFEMFATIGICAALGYFLDTKFNSDPVLVILFLFIGLTLAFYRIFKQLS